MGELLHGFQRRVHAVCYRMIPEPETAADLTQDTLVKVLQGLDRYDGRAALSTWVIRIAMNCCLSHLRKARLRKHESLEAGFPDDDEGGTNRGRRLASGEPGGPERVERTEEEARLSRALADLDPEARALLILRDLQDLEYGQIAEVLGVPMGTVKSRLFRARAALRRRIEQFEQGGRKDGGEEDGGNTADDASRASGDPPGTPRSA